MRFWSLLLPGAAACAAALSNSTLTPRYNDAGLDLQFNGCSSKEQKSYEKAIVDAKECLDIIILLRSGDRSGFDETEYAHEQEYRERYFGQVPDELETFVTDTFISVSDNIDAVPYNCGPKRKGNSRIKECWAISDWNEMTTCPHFFKLHDLARAITVIHELTHATHNGAAEDHVYHEGPAQLLAISDPETAARNADNYGLYAQRVCADKKGKKLVPTCKKNKKYC